jgi:hypothetical protein
MHSGRSAKSVASIFDRSNLLATEGFAIYKKPIFSADKDRS